MWKIYFQWDIRLEGPHPALTCGFGRNAACTNGSTVIDVSDAFRHPQTPSDPLLRESLGKDWDAVGETLALLPASGQP